LRFSAVSGVGGSKSPPLFAPETGVGQRVKIRGFKRVGIHTEDKPGQNMDRKVQCGDVKTD
jgi:hypothetical protein